VVADGKTTHFNHQFAVFNLQLASAKDMLAFSLVGALSGRQLDVAASLGKGENHFTFNPDLTAITNHSDFTVDVHGHNGNDFVNLSFGDVLESRLNVMETNIGGSKVPLQPTDVRDVLTFGLARSAVRNSTIDVNVDLGQGNNNLQFNYGIDLGHRAPAPGVPASASDFGPSTFNVNIIGSSRSQDVDNVNLFANGEINTGSTLNFNAQFRAGNNSFKAIFDASQFQVDDDGGQFISDAHSGGAAHFNVQGGTGNDTIDFHSINQGHTIELSGLFDINVIGGLGKDNIRTDFGGAGLTDDDPFELPATNRAFRERIIGGVGDSTIKVNLANAPTATFAWDVSILCGGGNNDITFIGTNPVGGAPSFGPAGDVFIDGGTGLHHSVDVFGNFPVDVVNG
jgi:hypothetical protein